MRGQEGKGQFLIARSLYIVKERQRFFNLKRSLALASVQKYTVIANPPLKNTASCRVFLHKPLGGEGGI